MGNHIIVPFENTVAHKFIESVLDQNLVYPHLLQGECKAVLSKTRICSLNMVDIATQKSHNAQFCKEAATDGSEILSVC